MDSEVWENWRKAESYRETVAGPGGYRQPDGARFVEDLRVADSA